MPKSVIVGAASAVIVLALFVLCLASFSHDPQTPIGLLLSPVYAVFVGTLIGIIHGSLSAIRDSRKSVVALVALPIATLLLLGFACWIIAEIVQNVSH